MNDIPQDRQNGKRTQHTALPWQAVSGEQTEYIVAFNEANEEIILFGSDEDTAETAEANAALIVRAVNSHDALVKLFNCANAIDKLLNEFDGDHTIIDGEHWDALWSSVEAASAALRAATGGQITSPDPQPDQRQ